MIKRTDVLLTVDNNMSYELELPLTATLLTY